MRIPQLFFVTNNKQKLQNQKAQKQKLKNTIAIVLQLFKYALPYWSQWLGLLLLSLIMIGVSLVDPLILRFLIDNVLIGHSYTLLGTVIVVFLFAKILALILIYIYGVSYEKFFQKILIHLRNDVFQHLEYKQIHFFKKRQVGDLLRLLTSDINAVRQILSVAEKVVVNTLRLSFILIIIMTLNWSITLLLLVVIPLYAWVQFTYIRRLRLQAKDVVATDIKLLSFLEERLSNILLIKLFSKEAHELSTETRLARNWVKRSIKLMSLILLIVVLIGSISAITAVAVLWLGGTAVIMGSITIGTLIATYTYAIQMFEPVAGLVSLPSSLQESLISAQRIFDILETEAEPMGGTSPVKHLRGDIKFSHVSFAYPENPHKLVLDNVSFHIKAGESVGLVGDSGSGKSTIFLLLLRLYVPTKGKIFLDGIPIEKFPLSFLRKHIGIAPQTHLLFPGTIRENITYAAPRASQMEIYRATTLAGIHQKIHSLPLKYQTLIGSAGGRLSEGEKQRLSLARVFLRSPDFFIFDEPTAALDSKNEVLIKHAMESVSGEQTSIIISHRLSAIEYVDRILVLDSGRLIEQGPHDALMKVQGKFFAMHAQQFPREAKSDTI
ncbi:MAG: hypothetical protein A2V81_00630 [Candidatus Abawacabacteria bacterium RBG_16_42_10]|uniref:ABC transporter n=1 Tax=Candidatus Abawacabacteria bacterium RBG_16_42_10 TaxID=1817814 RepID=A0A1F4XKL5_9BACT|nr:MAG: hypothetical protein A2V81_00630 [Candidatus Abawacabacteria bacterium RBG_16_42_10]